MDLSGPDATRVGPLTPTLHIRLATSDDAAAISAVILVSADKLTVHPDGRGAAEFLATLAPAAIDGCIRSTRFRYWVGTIDGVVAGLVAMRDYAHLFHLFVAPAYQRQGLAAQLWAHTRADALAHADISAFTVNASLYAAPVYRAFGFQDTSQPVEVNGIAFIPMSLNMVSLERN